MPYIHIDNRSYKTAEQAKRAIAELNGRFIGKKPIVVMLHIKKEQRRMHKQSMKESIGIAPQQVSNPAGHQLRQSPVTQGHGYHHGHGRGYDQSYAQQFDQSGYLGVRNGGGNYETRLNRRPGGAGGGFDMGRGMGPGQGQGQGSYNRSHVIGAEYEPHNVDSTSNGIIDYQQHVRKHQKELHAQEMIREEYRIRGRQIGRRHSAPQISELFTDQNEDTRSPEMGNNQHIPMIGFPRGYESQNSSQGQNQHQSMAQQQQQHQQEQEQRLRVLSLDTHDYAANSNVRYSHAQEHGGGTGSVSGVTSIGRSPTDSRRSHSSIHTPQKYDMGEFDQSVRLLSIQKNELHHQNFNFNPNQHQNQHQHQHQIHNGISERGIGYHPRERDSRQNPLDIQRHRHSRDSSPSMRGSDHYRSLESSAHGLMGPESNVHGLRSLESSTHGLRSMESSTHGLRSMESSTHGNRNLEMFVYGLRSLESSTHGPRSLVSGTHDIRGLESSVQDPRSLESSAHGNRNLEIFVHGLRSLESSTHGPRSLESSTHGIKSMNSSTHGAKTNDFSYRDDTGSYDEFNQSCISSLDGFSMLSKNNNNNNNSNSNNNNNNNNNNNDYNNNNNNNNNNSNNNNMNSMSPLDVYGSYYPSGILDPESHSLNDNSNSLACLSGLSQHGGSLIGSSPVQSCLSTVVSSRSSSIGNEEEGLNRDSSYTIAASLALDKFSDGSEVNESEDQKAKLYQKLFPLIETFKPFLARSITNYLIANAVITNLVCR